MKQALEANLIGRMVIGVKNLSTSRVKERLGASKWVPAACGRDNLLLIDAMDIAVEIIVGNEGEVSF